MAATDFIWTATETHVILPQYAVRITQTENFKKDRQLLDTTALEQWRLVFKVLDQSSGSPNRDNLFDHYNDTSNSIFGTFGSFSWLNANQPNHIRDSGTDKTVVYVSYQESVVLAKVRRWNIEIVLELVV